MSTIALPKVEPLDPIRPKRRGLSPWQVWGVALLAPYILVFAVFVVYLMQVPRTGSVFGAFDPLQPSVAPWTVAVTLGLYAVGGVYARRRRPGSQLATFVDQASVASFGVFLVHPLFLNTLLGRWFSWGYSALDPTLSGVVAWAATLVLSYAFAALVIRTPLALPLAGRKRLRPRPTPKVTHG